MIAGYTSQQRFGANQGTVWNPGPPDRTGYRPPPRTRPAAAPWPDGDLARPLVTVVGTLRDELPAARRSWSVWERQRLPDWLTVRYLFLDDGSTDGAATWVRSLIKDGYPVQLARMRGAGAMPERSWTLALNAAVRQLVRTPLVCFHLWDRIPGGLDYLRLLVEPHREVAGIVTSGLCRHLGTSNSTQVLRPGELERLLGTVDWLEDPRRLADLAGPLAGHLVPGRATESGAYCMAVEEFVALGGYDERYQARAGYAQVELFRRMLQAGLVMLWALDVQGTNYHQPHPANRAKGYGYLHDLRLCRNAGTDWGAQRPVEVFPCFP